MTHDFDLNRFVDAQYSHYSQALAEMQAGRKSSHWMWFIFPQMRGLGHSRHADFFGIGSRAEAEAYLAHPTLGARLREISNVLLTNGSDDPYTLMGGHPDDLKLRSSMTLFDAVAPGDVFARVLDRYFAGSRCNRTLELLKVSDLKSGEPAGDSLNCPEDVGTLDMVIAFDTTGSMSAYIDDVRRQVTELIPRLFSKNKDLRLGIVAFGDYCDMKSRDEFGDAYQSIGLTNDADALIKFVKNSRNTSGGDSDEFYELVMHKIINETAWRDNAQHTVLLIADADPHPLGYCYDDYVVKNQIDWRAEARSAAEKGIKFDTVTIAARPWYSKISEITGGVSMPFRSSRNTARMVEATVYARGSYAQREDFDTNAAGCADEEMNMVYDKLRKIRNLFDHPDSSKPRKSRD